MSNITGNMTQAIARCGSVMSRVPLVRSAWFRVGGRLARLAADADGTLSLRLAGSPFRVRASSLRDYVLAPYEPATTRWFLRSVRPGAAVLDIGAQFGYFSVLAGVQAGPTGRVLALEPEARNRMLLEANVVAAGLVGRVQVAPVAAGAAPGRLKLFAYARSDSHGMYPVPGAAVREVIEVDVVAGDEYLAGRAFEVIKIDVEGHEPAVLAGLEKTIGSSEVLFAELAPAFLARAGFSAADYLEQIRGLGFRVDLIDERNGALVAPETAMRDAVGNPAWYGNLYCRR